MEKVNIKRSRRSKRLRLTVNLDGTISLVVPWRVSIREAEQFLVEKKEWIEKALRRHNTLRENMPQRNFVSGETVPCFDCNYLLEVHCEEQRQRSHLKEEGLTLRIKGRDPAMVKQALISWYKKQAENYFTVRSQDYADTLGVSINTIAISKAKTQWGSCKASTGRLSFNWRLLLGPVEIADYVVAHEVAHMKHQNHSKEFWSVVEQLMPEYQERRKWLKQNGYKLVL